MLEAIITLLVSLFASRFDSLHYAMLSAMDSFLIS